MKSRLLTRAFALSLAFSMIPVPTVVGNNLIIAQAAIVEVIKEFNVVGVTGNYYLNEPFDGKGKIVIKYDKWADGSGGETAGWLGEERTEEVPLTADMLTGFDTSTVGSKQVYATYNGQKTSEWTITVERQKTITNIVFEGVKTKYNVGDPIDKSGHLKVTYDDGSTEEVTIPDNMWDFTTDKPVVLTIRATYGGVECSVEIEITDATSPSITGMSFTYDKNHPVRIPIPHFMGSGVNLMRNLVAQVNGKTVGTRDAGAGTLFLEPTLMKTLRNEVHDIDFVFSDGSKTATITRKLVVQGDFTSIPDATVSSITFDKATNTTNVIPFTYGKDEAAATSLTDIKLDGADISAHATVTGTNLTIAGEYLKTLDIGSYTVTGKFNDIHEGTLRTTVIVKDSSLASIPPSVTTTSVQFDFDNKADIVIGVDWGQGDEVASGILGLNVNGVVPSSTQINVSGNKIVVAKEYFETFENGNYNISVVFNGKGSVIGKVALSVINKTATVDSVMAVGYKDYYYVNEEFVEQGYLQVSMSDKTTKNVPLTLAMLSDFTTATVGTKTVHGTYGGRNFTMAIGVHERPVAVVDSITVKDVTRLYNVGDEFDGKGYIEAKYTDNSTNKIEPIDKDWLQGFDTSQEGAVQVEVFYDGKSDQYIMNVKDAGSSYEFITLSGMTVEYDLNAEFDGAGQVIYNKADGSIETINVTKDMLKDFDTSKAGTFTVTVTYNGLEATYAIKITDNTPATPKAITVHNVTNNYKVNEVFDGRGTVSVSMSDGSVKEVPLMKNMLSGFDTTTEGVRKVTVTYEGLTTEYTLVVSSADVSKPEVVDIKAGGFTTDYEINDIFDGKGELEVEMSNGTTQKVPITLDMLTGFDTSKLGSHKVIITYEGHTVEFTINVTEAKDPSKTVSITVEGVTEEYNVNDTFDGKGKVAVTMASGATKDVMLTSDMLSGFDTSTAGVRYVTVTYDGCMTRFLINVMKDTQHVPTEVFVMNQTTVYEVGGKFDNRGEVRVFYEDGDFEDVPLEDCSITWPDTSVIGNHTVKVVCKGIKTSYVIDVVNAGEAYRFLEVRHIIDWYLKNEQFNTEIGFATICVFENGVVDEVDDVELNQCKITGFDSSKAGLCDVVFEYDGLKTTKQVGVAEFGTSSETGKLLFYNPKTEYYVGESFNDTQGKLIYVEYIDEYKTPNTSQWSLHLITDRLLGFNTDKAGVKLISTEKNGITADYSINVIEKQKPESFDIKDVTTSYEVGDEFDGNGYIDVSYPDGATRRVPIKKEMLADFDTSKAGTVTVTVYYEGITKTYTITVAEKNADLPYVMKGEKEFTGSDITVKLFMGQNAELAKDVISLKIGDIVIPRTYEVEVSTPDMAIKDTGKEVSHDDSNATNKVLLGLGGQRETTTVEAWMLIGDTITIKADTVKALNLKPGRYGVSVTFDNASKTVSAGKFFIVVRGDDDEEPTNPDNPDKPVNPDNPGGNTGGDDNEDKPIKPDKPSSIPNSNGGGGGGGGSRGGSYGSGSPVKKPDWLWSDNSWKSSYKPKPPADGGYWLKGSDNLWYYYNNEGNLAKGWVSDGNNWYHINEKGNPDTGWFLDEDNSWYYLSKDESTLGGVVYGWYFEMMDMKWYFFSPKDGRMLSDWQHIDSKKYFFTVHNEGQTYFGSNLLGWVFDPMRNWKPFGSMFANETTPDGQTVDENGAKKN